MKSVELRASPTIPTIDVPGDAFMHRPAAPVELETLELERQLAGVPPEVRIGERPLAVEQQLVHLPELPVKSRGLRRGGGRQRVRMDFGQREMPEGKAKRVAQPGDARGAGSRGRPAGGSRALASPYMRIRGAPEVPRTWSSFSSSGSISPRRHV